LLKATTKQAITAKEQPKTVPGPQINITLSQQQVV
jgi:hypothetical protein